MVNYGWNDPPMLSTPSTAAGAPRQRLPLKRVGHDVNGTTAYQTGGQTASLSGQGPMQYGGQQTYLQPSHFGGQAQNLGGQPQGFGTQPQNFSGQQAPQSFGGQGQGFGDQPQQQGFGGQPYNQFHPGQIAHQTAGSTPQQTSATGFPPPQQQFGNQSQFALPTQEMGQPTQEMGQPSAQFHGQVPQEVAQSPQFIGQGSQQGNPGSHFYQQGQGYAPPAGSSFPNS